MVVGVPPSLERGDSPGYAGISNTEFWVSRDRVGRTADRVMGIVYATKEELQPAGDVDPSHQDCGLQSLVLGFDILQ